MTRAAGFSPRDFSFSDRLGAAFGPECENENRYNRDYYFEDKAYMKEMACVPGAYSIRDGVYHERLTVFEATLPG